MRINIMRSQRWLCTLAGVTLALLTALTQASADTPSTAPQWVRVWGAAPLALAASEQVSVQRQTVRQTVMLTHGGTQLRLRFSNLFGDAPLVIGAVTVAPADNPGQVHAVTFDGANTVSIPAGAPWLSDAVSMSVKAMQVLQVSIYLPEATKLATIHWDQLNHTILSGPGDFTRAASFDAVADTPLRPFLTGVDVLPAQPTKVVVAFGDSITDTHCKFGLPLCSWTTVLAQRLQAAGMNYAVANEAISGNRVLLDGEGESALARFDRDVLAVPGVTEVVMLEGVNDIGDSGADSYGIAQPVITAKSLIAGYQQLIFRAHQHGIKIIGCTMTPFAGAGYYSLAKDQVRNTVNDWIRHSGTFDGVVDFEPVVRDPLKPDHILPAMDRGGHLHPNGPGQRAMGQAIDLHLF